MPRVLVVEDRKRLSASLRHGLEEDGYDVATALTGEEGYFLASTVSGETVAISVTDTGCGISSEHLPHLFDRFNRVDPARSGDASGAGLGLSICKSIVRALDGRIDVQSAVEQGTNVTVTLPRAKSPT